MATTEREAVLALLLTSGIGHGLVGRLVETFGSATAALKATGRELGQVRGLGAKRGSQVRQSLDRILDDDEAGTEQLLATRYGVRLIALGDDDYPKLLQHIDDPPRLLWVRGELEAEDAVALGMVGARRCTHYGREQADRLAALGSQAGLTIVSGGAYGIDAAAHRAVLRVGGRTIAVIGSGLGEPYPKDHAKLFDEIADGHGAVLSELPMRTPPQPKQFPARNRIISGLSLGVLVVEAARRSGALITARLCVEEHGRECMALPGRADSAMSEGCHQLIRKGGATLVTNLAEVLDALGETGELLKAGMTQVEPGREAEKNSLDEATWSDAQKQIMGAIAQPVTLDQIAAVTGLAAGQVQSELTMLEVRGQVRRRGGLFERKSV